MLVLWLWTQVALFPLAAQTEVSGESVGESVRVGRDTVALPPLSYAMRVGADTLMWPDSSAVWCRFFAELEALREGKDTVITIVHLGD